jgi:cellulose synthase/poly-beta-1,6-N-acetylglucosamine synthase-like glycosyltransferase
MNQRVSIIIIGRNEEAGIGKCIEAALSAADQIGGAEIIFVDSASTDRSVSIARSCGVRVLSLKPAWKLTPSAGRFIGSHFAKGEFVLFLDADTLVYRDFLPHALRHFDDHADLGGINGYLDDLNEKGEIMLDVEERYPAATDVKWLRGPCCFYRKEALEKVGSFNPYLAVEEEAELGLRLIKNGWRLQQIPVPMACHTRCFNVRTVRNVISTYRRDIVSRRFGEITKTIGCAFSQGFGLAFCWVRLKTTIVFLAWLFLLFLSLFLPADFYPKAVFSLLAVLGMTAVLVKKRSVKQSLLFISDKIYNFIDVLAGVHKISVKSPGSYPLDVVDHAPAAAAAPAPAVYNQVYRPAENYQATP